MLVFRCKAGDTVTIGEVQLKITKSTETNLGLAISAPRELAIDHVKKADAAAITAGASEEPQALHK